MASTDDLHSLTRAFSGLGVDEKALISLLGRSHSDHRRQLRKVSRDFFTEDERQFERWNERHILQLRQEFLRVKEAIVLYLMHPWERDARLIKEALHKDIQYSVLIEVAGTRSSEELLGARRAYHSLFERSIEEDVLFHIRGPYAKLFLGLLSSYRYEGPKVNEESAKSEAKSISEAVKGASPHGKVLIEAEDIVRILSTRSKPHLKVVYHHYKEITGHNLDEDLASDAHLKEAVQCLITPRTYFVEVLGASLEASADETAKDGLTRIVTTRADVDIEEIAEEYREKRGVGLAKKIEDVANGNYRDFLVSLISRGGAAGA